MVLAIIRNRLGANCYDGNGIKPDLIAFEHWLLNQIGVKHHENIIEETRAMLKATNDNDLREARKNLNKTEEEENA